MPALLAIETSQRIGGVALRDGSGRDDVEMLRAARRHDDDLLPAIDRVCRRLGVAPGELAGVGISIGPGGFTGLRIAVSTAKMLAETTGARLVAVPSALVAAESLAAGTHPARSVVVGLAAKAATFWCTRLARGDEGWSIVGEPGLVAEGGLDLEGVEAVLADRHLPAWARERCAAAGVEIVERFFDPAAALAAAARLLARQRTVDPLALAPLYPRPPEAVTIWERRHLDPQSGASADTTQP